MERSLREDRYTHHRTQRDNPSFSSTLLDAIYRSIDEGEDELVLYRESMRKKRSSNCTAVKGGGGSEKNATSLHRACVIEKTVSEKVVVRRKSAADLERKPRNHHHRDSSVMFLNSSSSSSDSSSGGRFSSSEAESVYGVSSRSSCFSGHRPKPIRTSVSVHPEKLSEHNLFDNCTQRKNSSSHQKPKHENGFVKTKSKAMKIYGDLKKAKQPISPGGRLASFLNSLFTTGNAKKAKISSSPVVEHNDHRSFETSSENKSKSAYTSTCSSASSFSRSCLSKTPSSRGKLSNGMKRSVRFYPVSVIVDEDCQPCGHKSLYKDDSMNEELKFHVMEKNRRVEEAARDLLKSYQKKVEIEFNMRNAEEFDDNDEDEEDDDDVASCASSDLFELDNLSVIGIERYREELPVYETTHLDTNRAIANGLIS